MSRAAQSHWLQLAGLIVLLLGWQALSRQMGSMVLATPWETVQRLVALASSGEFWLSLSTTLSRLAAGLVCGSLVGFGLGVLAGRSPALKHFLEPFRWVLMSIPPVVVVLLAMLWFGMGHAMVVFITVLLLTPTIYVNTCKGIEQIDPCYLELVAIYRFSPWQRLIRLYIPAIAAPLCAAMVLVCCNGVRIVVLAEVLGAHNGLGYELANAQSNFDMAELYAWVSASLLLVALLEFLLLRPTQRYLLRWQS